MSNLICAGRCRAKLYVVHSPLLCVYTFKRQKGLSEISDARRSSSLSSSISPIRILWRHRYTPVLYLQVKFYSSSLIFIRATLLRPRVFAFFLYLVSHRCRNAKIFGHDLNFNFSCCCFALIVMNIFIA